ncbi:MAG: tetratricopeptide repeat protein, partial [Deltaproteobacteria bacterium]|nr:tetratricopeptide repeat protein [Deltaproteobacteria bacterium]
VIALVVSEMKRLGKIKFIPLQEHLDLLALLNETIGGAAGSSEKENLLPRIYKKWKDVLPNLEEAPLFKVLGRKKEEGDGAIGKIYSFTDVEKDGWANLFEYLGSEENVRLKFAVDKIGVGLNETSIIFGDSRNGEAWDQFIASLKKKEEEEEKEESVSAEETAVSEPPVVPSAPPQKRKISWLSRYRWVMLSVVFGIVAGAIWKIYLSPGPIPIASVDRMKYPLPDNPSIAVLPFVNISGDPKQEFFCNGITEEIITALSRVPGLFVIARYSTFTYKGKAVNVKQVSEELGVRYVLEGGVQKSVDRIRITVQLIDALKGHHLWAERYDRDLKNIFALQDELTMKIITALQVKLTPGETVHLMAKGTKNIDAYVKHLQASELIGGANREGIAEARKLLEEAIALDPAYARLYVTLGMTHHLDMWYGTTKSPEQSLARAFELARKAISLDDSSAFAHSALGKTYAMAKQYDKAIAECEQAVSLDPNSSINFMWLGLVLTWAGRAEEGIRYLEHAIRLNPFAPAVFFNNLAVAYRDSGQYEKAIEECKKALQREPNSQFPYIHMAISYMRLGREEEARAAAAEILRINPKFSLQRYAKMLPFTQPVADRIVEDLRKAGLK